jgi:hypothetical protein
MLNKQVVVWTDKWVFELRGKVLNVPYPQTVGRTAQQTLALVDEAEPVDSTAFASRQFRELVSILKPQSNLAISGPSRQNWRSG